MGAVFTAALLVILVGPVQVAGDMGQTTDPICTGDCNGDGRVTIGEILKCINMLFRPIPTVIVENRCSGIDVNQSGTVEIAEIVQAVDNALDGCSDSD